MKPYPLVSDIWPPDMPAATDCTWPILHNKTSRYMQEHRLDKTAWVGRTSRTSLVFPLRNDPASETPELDLYHGIFVHDGIDSYQILPASHSHAVLRLLSPADRVAALQTLAWSYATELFHARFDGREWHATSAEMFLIFNEVRDLVVPCLQSIEGKITTPTMSKFLKLPYTPPDDRPC